MSETTETYAYRDDVAELSGLLHGGRIRKADASHPACGKACARRLDRGVARRAGAPRVAGGAAPCRRFPDARSGDLGHHVCGGAAPDRRAGQRRAAARLRLQRLLRRPAQRRPSERHGLRAGRGRRVGRRRRARAADALAVGYEVVGACSTPLDRAGRLGLHQPHRPSAPPARSPASWGSTPAQTREALAITVVPHVASDEIESGELNPRGDLTMWKRFNGSDAVRNALYACLLASVGVEGAVRPVRRQARLPRQGQERRGSASGARASACPADSRWPASPTPT